MSHLPYVDELTVGLSQGRALAFSYIPRDSNAREARGWLSSQLPWLTSADRDFVVDLHLHDLMVAKWRMGDSSI